MNITSSTLKEGNVLVDDAADKVIAALGGNDVLRAISVLDHLDTAWTLLSRLSS